MLPVAFASIVIGVSIGLLRGGSVVRLLNLPIRHVWLVFVGFGAQVLLFEESLRGIVRLQDWLGDQVALVLGLTNLTVLAMLLLNLRLPGIKLIALGLGLNVLVMLANDGYMPVSAEALHQVGLSWRVAELEAKGHSDKSRLIDADTRLGFLSDVIAVAPLEKVFSIGDLVVGVGAAWLIAAGMSHQAPKLALRTNDGSAQS